LADTPDNAPARAIEPTIFSLSFPSALERRRRCEQGAKILAIMERRGLPLSFRAHAANPFYDVTFGKPRRLMPLLAFASTSF
jgi:hypothetical protein